LASRLPDGSIQLSDGRIVYANSLILGADLCEIVPLCVPPPAWPFVSGGGGGGAGPQGPAGPAGSGGGGAGTQGQQGFQGTNPGPAGPQGNNGPQGFQGLAGSGTQGFQGSSGLQGNQGNQGLTGSQGNQGNQGNAGAQGNQGNQGTAGTQGFQGFQGPSNAGADIFAATRVVSLIPGDGTDLTIAAAIAALPAEGGYIYVKQGTYPQAATLTMPDKPVIIRGSGDGTVISLGANAIPAFTIPTGLSVRRDYVFENMLVTGTSVANQKIWSIEDANGFGVVRASHVNSTEIQFPIHITDGFGTEITTVCLDDCHFRLLADGSSILVNQPALTAVPTNVWMQRVWFYTEYSDAITGALTSDAVFATSINFLGEDCVLAIGTSSIVGCLNLTDSHIFNFGPGANPVISVFGDDFGIIPDCLVGCSGQFVNFSLEGNGCAVIGGRYRSCSFTDGAISFFTDIFFFTDLTVESAVIIGTGNTFIKGCEFTNKGTTFVLDGNFASIVGCEFSLISYVGLTSVIRTTNGTAKIADNRFVANTVPAILEAGAISTNNIDNNRWATNPTLLNDSDAVVNGFKRKNITGGATVDALTAVFTHVNDKGLAGAGSLKNTGANDLTVRRTVTDGYGTTDFQEDVVLSGASIQWPMDTAIGTAFSAYVSFTISVKSTTPGSPTTYDLRHSSTGAY